MLQRQGSLDADGNPVNTAKDNKKAAAQAPKAASSEERLGPIAWLRRYLREVMAEFKKVTFPTRDEVRSYSIIVFAFLVIMTTLIGLLDFGLSHLVLKVFS